MNEAKTNSWNWDKVESDFWSTPSEDVYYFLHRWKGLGLTRLLDLGCGIGRHALLFARHGFEVTAFDLGESGLKKLASSARDEGLRIRTVHGDFLEMDLPEAGFDAVLAYHAIYHVDSGGMNRTIENIARILKPGGEIYFTMISKTARAYTAPENTTVDDNVRLKEEEDGSILPHFFVDYDDIERLLSGKFEILKARYIEDIYTDRSGRGKHYFVLAGRK
ncbi:MAG: class I SAM-dependent methyltransferase [Spirochaetales bacterium]|nr:class I SAM-dependent methyltransferase [Spirochaetales bacterium]